jgi:hypothetical protein
MPAFLPPKYAVQVQVRMPAVPMQVFVAQVFAMRVLPMQEPLFRRERLPRRLPPRRRLSP